MRFIWSNVVRPAIQKGTVFDGSLNVAVSTSDYAASNDRMVSTQWIGKDVEGIGRVISGIIPNFTCSDWEKSWKAIQSSQCTGLDLNPELPNKEKESYHFTAVLEGDFIKRRYFL